MSIPMSYRTQTYDPSGARSSLLPTPTDSTPSKGPASSSDGTGQLMPISSSLMTPITGIRSLSEFVCTMSKTEITGPYFLKRAHEGKYLGRGAQFQPYIDHRKKVWKRGAMGSALIHLAIKRPLFQLPAYPGRDHPLGFGSPKQLQDFQLEVLALCHPPLRSHRNIVKLLAWGLDYDPRLGDQVVNPISPILMVEHANCSLRELLARARREIPIPILVRRKLCFDVCNAVSVLHNCGIVHGDIKTDNILIFPAEKAERCCLAKLSDFGLSVGEEQANSSRPRSYSGLGTPGWQAPELVHGSSVVKVEDLPKCDLYSLGLVLWSVISGDGGCPLVAGGDRGQDTIKLASSFVNASDLEGPVKESIGEVLEQLLQSDPQKRESSLGDICERLRVAPDISPTSATEKWVSLLRKPDNKISDLPLIQNLENPDNTSMYIYLTPEPTPGPQVNEDIFTSWNNVFDLFSRIQEKDRRIVIEMYQNGIYDILRRNPSADSDVVGLEFSGQDILSMCFVRTPRITHEDLCFLPPEVCLGRVASCILVAAKKRSIAAKDLARHFTSVLPPGVDINSDCIEWAWQTITYGSVLNWDLQRKNPLRFSKSWETFRKRGGFNTHYVHFSNERLPPKQTGSGLLEDPLQWLQQAYPLHHAAARGDVGILEGLLKDGQYADQLDARGETALMKACMAGSGECARLLLQYNASPAIRSRTLGTLPLHWLFVFDESTAQISKLAIALAGKDLANLGVVCNAVPALFFPFHWPVGTPLDWAVVSNNSVAIDCLVALGGDLNTVPDYFPEPVARDDWSWLEQQRANEAALVSHQIYYASGLQDHRHSAVLEQQRYIVHARRAFFRQTASLCAFQQQSLAHFGNELNVAIAMKQTERAERLIKGGFDLSQFHPGANQKWCTTLPGAISSGGDVRLIRSLLEGGANVHGTEHQAHAQPYIYPLTLAALRQNHEIVMLLIEEYGADVNRLETNYIGDTEGPYGDRTPKVGNALQAAIMGPKNGLSLVRYLISKGANVNATAGRYHSALNCAVLRNDEEILDNLLKAGANIHDAGGEFGNPIAAASHSSSSKIVQILLDHGADINAVSCRDKITPLLAALTPISYPRNPATALLLIDRGADINISSDPPYGLSENALQAAVKVQAKPVVKRLLEMGASPGVIQGRYLRQAVEFGSMAILRLLVENGLKIGKEEAKDFLEIPRISDYHKLRRYLRQFTDESSMVSASGKRVSAYEQLMKDVAWKVRDKAQLGEKV